MSVTDNSLINENTLPEGIKESLMSKLVDAPSWAKRLQWLISEVPYESRADSACSAALSYHEEGSKALTDMQQEHSAENGRRAFAGKPEKPKDKSLRLSWQEKEEFTFNSVFEENCKIHFTGLTDRMNFTPEDQAPRQAPAFKVEAPV